MKHFVFPTSAKADAFIADLQSQGVVEPEVGHTSFHRRSAVQEGTSSSAPAQALVTEVVDGGGDAGDVAGGALKGGVIGTVAGLAAGALVASTGGLAAIPVVLGLGVGAAAGAADGAVHGHGMEEHAGRRYEENYHLEDEHYDRLQSEVGTQGVPVAVEDAVPAEVVEAAAARHGGRLISGA
ncbi:hypothetical protein [Deinococcus navajonensis]|uniref:Glycine zipper domain-containing protein n=1 Tax=Deinococcus navajonensis TaxID=309884 RepID=A0ABV8XK78_9DEIO